MKKLTKAYIKKQEQKRARKALKEWAIQCRSKGFCEICRAKKGDLKPNGKPVILNAHHVLPREFELTTTDPRNSCCLCQECHKFKLNSAHRNALWFINWFMQHRQEDYEYLKEKLENNC